MTDTTDIAALREGLIELLDHVDSYGGKCWLFPEDVRLIISLLDKLDVAEKKNVLVAGGIEAALKMQEQLEAERQRADYGQQVINQRNAECDRLINEIAELKAKLANPVVLPERRLPTPSILTFSDAIKAINKAGFTVKGE